MKKWLFLEPIIIVFLQKVTQNIMFSKTIQFNVKYLFDSILSFELLIKEKNIYFLKILFKIANIKTK